MIGPETLQGPVRWPSCALQPATIYCTTTFANCRRQRRTALRRFGGSLVPFIHISEKASRAAQVRTPHIPMNWTEGNLARHSRGGRGKEMLQRQKQHFAKVRSVYFNNQKGSPRSLRDEIRSPTDRRGWHGQRPESPVLNEAKRGQKRTRASRTQCLDPPGVTTEAEHSLNITSVDISPVQHVQGSAAKRLRLLNKQDWTGKRVSPPAAPGANTPHLGRTIRFIGKGQTSSSWDSAKARFYPHQGRQPGYAPRESRFSRVRHARSSSERSTSTNLNGGKAYLRRGVKLGADSSSPSSGILQPVPCRMHSIIFDPLLRSWSPNSDADDSLIAQIGRAQPVVLPERQEENNRWVQLMCPSDSGLSTDTSRPLKLAGLNYFTLRAEEANTSDLTSEATAAFLTRPSILKPRCSPEAQPTGAPENNEPSIAMRIGPEPVSRLIPASFEREEQQPDALLKYRPTGPTLASEPAIGPQRSVVNDRKSEYDAWIKSFLSSDDSDDSLNQQALHDAGLDAVQVIQCTRLKKAASTEDSHEGVVFRNPLGAAGSTAKAAASHVAMDGSVYSSLESGSLTLESAGESSERLPSASIQAKRSISEGNCDRGVENHEWQHARSSFFDKLDCLASESHSLQGTVSHKLEVMSDASIRGNAPASTTHAMQNPMIRGPASAYDIKSVVAEPAQSSSSEGHGCAFKFAAPKLFVGKRATQSVSMTPELATVATRRGRKGRSRDDSLQRESHGRTSIRHLPNYDGDPIEEFSDEVDLIAYPKSPPLFGALQTE
ncbi:hypothetical protein PspLS_05815 [Pyricularia sp. CBS 133598]|nr:hypothetical protein PspLS_05815 [Pyricularia sp. CBS 133598]